MSRAILFADGLNLGAYRYMISQNAGVPADGSLMGYSQGRLIWLPASGASFVDQDISYTDVNTSRVLLAAEIGPSDGFETSGNPAITLQLPTGASMDLASAPFSIGGSAQRPWSTGFGFWQWSNGNSPGMMNQIITGGEN